MNRVMKGLVSLFWSLDLKAVEYGQAILAMLWGVALLAPGNTFDRPAYRALAALLGNATWAEVAWGLGMLALGFVHVFCLNRAMRGGWTHQIALGAGALVWPYVAVAFGLIQPPSAGGSVYFLVGFGAFWLFLRTGLRRGG
jgi:hypothetical protein